jgi:CopG family nickel-responsive transcriptional regulator
MLLTYLIFVNNFYTNIYKQVNNLTLNCMPIVSVSLNKTILHDIDKLQQLMGYSGRSEIIRSGVRLLISENKENEQLIGDINAILIVIHTQDAENVVSDIKHHYEDVTATQIHSHLKNDKCLELFIVEGQASRIKKMMGEFRTSRKMDLVKLIIA